METRANYVAIGLFTLILTAITFGFVYWLARYDDAADRVSLTVHFEGSVVGLTRGGSVLFNGIKVGSVNSLELDPSNPGKVFAGLQLRSDTPVKPDTSATLSYTGLTGVAYIELSGGSADADNITGSDLKPILTASPSAFQDLVTGATAIMKRADTVLSKIENVIDLGGPSVIATIENAKTFSAALAKNADKIETLVADASGAARGLADMSNQVGSFASRAEVLIDAVDTEKVNATINNAELLTRRLALASKGAELLVSDARSAVGAFGNIADKLVVTVDKVDAVVSAVEPAQISQTVKNITDFSGSIAKTALSVDDLVTDVQVVAEDLGRFSKKLNSTMDQVTAVVASVEPTTVRNAVENFNLFSSKLNDTLGNVDVLIAAIDPVKVRAALDDIGSFVNALQNNSDAITVMVNNAKQASQNINAFSATVVGQSGNIEQIVADAKELAARMNVASVKVDSILTKVDAFLTSDGTTKSLMDDVRSAASAINNIAKSFESRADEISGGLARFSSKGLRDIENLVGNARQTFRKLDRVVGNLERDPGRFLFGGKNVREFQGRRR